MAAVAPRYARALVDSLFGNRTSLEPSKALDQLRSFEATLEDSSELRNLLGSPAVLASSKRDVIRKIGERLGIEPLVRNFLYVVSDHRRLNVLPQIREAVELLVDQRLGLVRAHVSSAVEMNVMQQQRLQAELSRLTGKQVRCDFAVDPSLIAGVTTRIGTTIYDGSVRGELDALRRQLAG